MKNKLFIFILASFTIVFMIQSCKKRNFWSDKEPVEIGIQKSQIAFGDQIFFRNYSVNIKNDPYKIPFGFTNISNEDRVIRIEYSSRSALNGTHYNAPDSIIIPAGKSVDSLTFTGNFNLYPVGRVDTVKLKIKSPEPLLRMDTLMLTLQRYCDVVLSSLGGNYRNTFERNNGSSSLFGPYTTQIQDLKLLTPTTAEGIIVNLFNEDWNDIKFIMNWTDPNNFRITIPLQPTGSISPIKWVRGALDKKAPNSFSSCLQRFSISLDLLNYNKDIAPADSLNGVNPVSYQFLIRR
jgi:hypothetical protein